MNPDRLRQAVKSNAELLVKLRRDFHRHPELSFKEVRTAGIAAGYLREYGYTVREQVGITGVVGIINGAKPGKTIMLRFDMDGLPVREENNCDYCSQYPGVMHACGHDGHTSIGIVTARILAENRQDIAGRIMIIFQPAEEGYDAKAGMTSGGAAAMIADGLLSDYQPDACAAIHLWNELPAGKIVIHPGPLMAGADIIEICIHGKGGHGAIPQETADPVLAGAQVLTGLQSIISRNISPLDTVVLSITEFHAGDAPNVIPSQAILRGSLRTFSTETRDKVIGRIQMIADGIAGALGCRAEIRVNQLAPAVINAEGISAVAIRSASTYLAGQEIDRQFKVMVSEDMAFFMNEVPGCYMLVGSANPAKGLDQMHHNPLFNFDESAMETAVNLLAGLAFEYLK